MVLTASSQITIILFLMTTTYYLLIHKTKVPLWNLMGGAFIIILGLVSGIIEDSPITLALLGGSIIIGGKVILENLEYLQDKVTGG